MDSRADETDLKRFGGVSEKCAVGVPHQLSAWPATGLSAERLDSSEVVWPSEAEWQAAYEFMRTFRKRHGALRNELSRVYRHDCNPARYYEPRFPGDTYDGSALGIFCFASSLVPTTDAVMLCP